MRTAAQNIALSSRSVREWIESVRGWFRRIPLVEPLGLEGGGAPETRPREEKGARRVIFSGRVMVFPK